MLTAGLVALGVIWRFESQLNVVNMFVLGSFFGATFVATLMVSAASRVAWRWRILPAEQIGVPANATSARQFTVREILAETALIAAVLAVWSYVPLSSTIPFRFDPIALFRDFLETLLVLLLFASPALWMPAIVFAERWSYRLAAWTVLAAVDLVATFVGISIIENSPPADRFVPNALLAATYASAMLSLFVLRLAGYRLTRRQKIAAREESDDHYREIVVETAG